MSVAVPVSSVERRPLRRRTEQRAIAGVSGGIADRINAPVRVIRLLTLLVAGATDWGLAVYPLAILLIPARGDDRPGWDTVIGLSRYALLVCGLFLAQQGGVAFFDQPFSGFVAPMTAWYAVAGAGAAVIFTADYRRGPRDARTVRASVLAALPVVCAAVALFAGIVLVPDARWERFLAFVPLTGAIALAVATRAPRARLFLAPAVVAIAFVAYIGATKPRLDGGVGNLRVVAGKDPGRRVVARRAIGDVAVDLRRTAAKTGSVVLDASVGYGTLRVAIPDGSPVRLDLGVGRGLIDAWFPNSPETAKDKTGLGEHLVMTNVPRRGAPRPAITINASVGLGDIEIRRGRSVTNDGFGE